MSNEPRPLKNSPYFKRPRILVVDEDHGRIEYLENHLFRAGYQISKTGADEVAAALDSEPLLVVTYLALDVEQITARGIAVLVMVADEEMTDDGKASHTLVGHLPSSASAEALIDEIRAMLSRGHEED